MLKVICADRARIVQHSMSELCCYECLKTLSLSARKQTAVKRK